MKKTYLINWNNRARSAEATLTLTWATAQMLEGVNLYYYYDNCCAYPESVEFSYSLNGQEYTTIEATAEQAETYSLGAQYKYTFAQPINPVGLKIKLTQQNGTSGSNCVGLTELEVMTYAASVEYNTSADLSTIKVDSVAINGFNADTLAYEAEEGEVSAETSVNAGITILPVYEGVVRVLTISEDGGAAKFYEITLIEKDVCQHSNTEKKNEVAANCTTEGYTGDIYCSDCGNLLETGAAIGALGHKWDNGVVTKEPTETETGIKTFTCTVCGETRTEEVVYVKELKTPTVSLNVSTNSNNRIMITGQVDDYENLDEYYEITSHGILFINTSRIGNRVLTTNTSGRTRVNLSTYKEDGSFTYNLKPSSTSTSYTMRAFVIYKDTKTGKSVTVYSDMVRGSYNTLK